MERTLIILKPDAVQRGLCGEILTRFEKKGIQVVGMKLMKIPTSLAETHYGPHKGKPFYDGLVKFMTSSPVLVLVLAGKDVINISRKDEEFENTRKNHQRALDSMQASLEAEARGKAEALRMKKKLESDINELEIALDHANKANAEAACGSTLDRLRAIDPRARALRIGSLMVSTSRRARSR